VEPIWKKELPSKTRTWWVSSGGLLVLVRGNVKPPTLVRKIQAYGRSDRVGYSPYCSFLGVSPADLQGNTLKSGTELASLVVQPRIWWQVMLICSHELSLPNTQTHLHPERFLKPIAHKHNHIHTTNHKWSCVSLGSWRVKNRGNTEKTKSYTTSQKTTKFPHIKKFVDFLKIFSYPFWFEKGYEKIL
jgi:hypothetical protein